MKKLDRKIEENLKIGDTVVSEDETLQGEVVAIDEDSVTIAWSNGEEIVEEVVALDEISKKTLGSYVKKAKNSLKNIERNSKRAEDTMNKTDSEARYDIAKRNLKRHTQKYNSRAGYVNKATDKLTKESVNEDSVALQSLKAGSHTIDDPKSKLEVMRAVLGKLGAMEDSDAISFFNKMMAGIGHEADSVGDNSAKNRDSIKAKPSDAIKEDVAKLFEGQEVSEEFKERVTTLFEAAVAARVALFEAEIEEAYSATLDEEVEALEELFNEELNEINERVESYLDSIGERWLEENEIAIESTLRNELTEDFINGLKNLFAEHYIEVPEDKIDILEQLALKVEALEEAYDSVLVENNSLRDVIAETVADDVFETVADGLALSDVEKFRTLSESVEFDGDENKYAEKLKYIREAHFKSTKSTPKVILEDTFNEPIVEAVDPRVSAYYRALAK